MIRKPPVPVPPMSAEEFARRREALMCQSCKIVRGHGEISNGKLTFRICDACFELACEELQIELPDDEED